MLEIEVIFYCCKLNSKAGVLFSNRGDKIVCGISVKSKNGVNTLFSFFVGYRTSFLANLLFGYAQRGSKRNSFSGPTVHIHGSVFQVCILWCLYNLEKYDKIIITYYN